MGRTRENRITESAAELRRLAKRYAGRAQESRLLFLIWVKENPGCTIRQAAERAGITERHGRYLWEDYCNGGVERVIARRIGRRKKEEPAPEGTVAGMTAADMVRFMKVVEDLGNINDPVEWGSVLKKYLMNFLPEVDYAVVNLLHNPKSRSKNNLLYNRNFFPDGVLENVVHPFGRLQYKEKYMMIIEDGKKGGFPFSMYHSPPFGIDLYSTSGREKDYIGSILLFREISKDQFSAETISLVKRLIPFFELLLSAYQTRVFSVKPGSDLFYDAVANVAGNVGLTNREKDVMFLLLLGHTHDEIAELLKVTPATVNKHTRSVYKKAGVRRLSEFFARYFTPRDYFPERGEEKGKEE